MESVGDAALGCQLDHVLEHVARSRHAEADVAGAMQHHVRGLDEIFRTFLHRDSAEKGHDFL
jgi:hypothetical protein